MLIVALVLSNIYLIYTVYSLTIDSKNTLQAMYQRFETMEQKVNETFRENFDIKATLLKAELSEETKAMVQRDLER